MYSLMLFVLFFATGITESCEHGYCDRKDVVLQRRHHWGCYGIITRGSFLISDPCNSKVATCFAGGSGEKNPVSILNLSTSIDKLFEAIPVLNNDTPVSAVNLIDDSMIAVAHGKNVYIFAEQDVANGMLSSFI